MADIANYRTLKYGARTGFRQIHTFCIDVQNSSHISCFTIQKHEKSKEGMTLLSPSIAAIGIESTVGAGGSAGILVAEASRSRRREAPISNV